MMVVMYLPRRDSWCGRCSWCRRAAGFTFPAGRNGRIGGDRLRASHAEREQVVEALTDAFVEGRLDRGELDARAGRALTARTRAELAAISAEIPDGLAEWPAQPPTSTWRLAAVRPSLVQRRPVLWGVGGAGGCLVIGFGLLVFGSEVIAPDGAGHPYNPWVSTLWGMLICVVMMTGLGIAVHGLGTAEDRRRVRRQVPRV